MAVYERESDANKVLLVGAAGVVQDLTLGNPAGGGFAVTPNDSANLSATTTGIYVGVSGHVKVDMANGNTITFPNLQAGVIHPIRARRVYATGTTATSIVGVING